MSTFKTHTKATFWSGATPERNVRDRALHDKLQEELNKAVNTPTSVVGWGIEELPIQAISISEVNTKEAETQKETLTFIVADIELEEGNRKIDFDL